MGGHESNKCHLVYATQPTLCCWDRVELPLILLAEVHSSRWLQVRGEPVDTINPCEATGAEVSVVANTPIFQVGMVESIHTGYTLSLRKGERERGGGGREREMTGREVQAGR